MTILLGFLALLIPIVLFVGVIYFIIRVSRGNTNDPKNLTTREVLIDAGIFLSLVTSIVALISIIFSAIDKKFVDVLKPSYYGGDGLLNEDVRVAVSVILVAYPIYLVLAFMRAKYLRENVSRRSITAMKFVNYFTLAVASIFIVGSLVTTIYQYLGGELGIAFLYKILTVVLICLGLGIYNYFTLKRDYDAKSNLPNLMAVVSLVLVVASVVYSISILGSPSKIRKIRFDEKRLTDLSNIQQEILSNWQRNKVLPASLQDIQGDGFNSAFVLPKDPTTAAAYEYKIVQNSVMQPATGQDCATFYPGKFNYYPGSTSYDVSKLTCQIPTKAVFEICGTFETVRAYDENGIDQSIGGWYSGNSLGVKTVDAMSSRYYEPTYFDGYTKNPNWNHDATYTCYKRTIDPLKYPSY